MLVKDLSLSTPQENLLLDDVLLYLAELGQSPELLRFWESAQLFIVLGRTSKVEEDIYIERAYRDHIPVFRRSSGGGTVIQGPGCLNYSFVLAKEHHPSIMDIRKSYQYILNKVIIAMASLGVQSIFQPISDLVLQEGQRKFSGNAQRRGKRFILHHGTILYHFDITKMEGYLKVPKDFPVYRKNRLHQQFVKNIPASPPEIKKAIAEVFEGNRQEDRLNRREQESLQYFLQTKNLAINLQELINCNK